MLGTESGVSAFDIDDRVRAEYEELKRDGHEPTLEELEEGTLGRLDGVIEYRTIGPRHFEAAALRVCQVLYEGHYSGAMEPMVHYIPLRKDFSNLEQVLQRLSDPALRRELTENAYRDLIASGRYSYAGFVAEVDRVLRDAGLQPAANAEAPGRIERALRQRRLFARAYAGHWLRHRRFRGRRTLETLARPAARGIRRLRGAGR